MKLTGILSKMKTWPGPPVKYQLLLSVVPFDLTAQVGKVLSFKFSGKIFCINCGKATRKSYSQGYCFPCTIKLAACDLCILRPETCHFDQGSCREPQWGMDNCMQPHIIYLANSSGPKVGITRKGQVPTRWMDQGATQALPIMEVKSRLISGKIEVLFKQHIADKTDWRKMLKGDAGPLDLLALRDKLLLSLLEELRPFEYQLVDGPLWEFKYPVNRYPEKVSSFNLDKVPHFSSRLMGIKGQYLIFENGVLNIRAHTGYEVTIEGETHGTEDNLPQGLPAIAIPD